MKEVTCSSQIKHFHYLIGKYCKDNNIPIHINTWERVSKWENDFDSTKNEEYQFLGFSKDEICGMKSLNDSLVSFEEFISLYLSKYHISRFKHWDVNYKDDNIIFGCSEVILTKDEIKNWLKIHKILDKKEITIEPLDIKIIEKMVE